jgi:hypothetical protein
MSWQFTKRPSAISVSVRRMYLLFLIAGIGMLPLFSANASAVSRGAMQSPNLRADELNVDGHNGNGKHNRNTFTTNSPTFNRGIQHVSHSNAGGINNIQAGFCKKTLRRCKTIQKVVINR